MRSSAYREDGLEIFSGAFLPWRFSVGITAVAPVFSFFALIFCPESPVWLMTKGRNQEARGSLEKLRGVENEDIIEAELNRIDLNLRIEAKEEEILAEHKLWDILVDPTFYKPFALLMLLFCINLEWCGLAAVGFYFVPLLK